MISNFFVLSPRGDTILSKIYRTNPEIASHERKHTEAFFRKVKFWDGMNVPGLDSGVVTSSSSPSTSSSSAPGASSSTNLLEGEGGFGQTEKKGDAPPVFVMPDGQSYLHVKRNGLIFACATARNVSPCTVIEVSF